MKKFSVFISDLTPFAKDRLSKMKVIHFGDLVPEAQDAFCSWFGMDVDNCLPVCDSEEVIK